MSKRWRKKQKRKNLNLFNRKRKAVDGSVSVLIKVRRGWILSSSDITAVKIEKAAAQQQEAKESRRFAVVDVVLYLRWLLRFT